MSAVACRAVVAAAVWALAVVVAGIWALAVGAPAAAAPTMDDQVYEIARELFCPVCAGQTVAESGVQLAQQMREIIRERLQRGESREQIIAYFVGQFGEGVLARPPRRGAALLVWLALPAALVVGVVVLGRFIRRRRPEAPQALEAPSPTAAEVEEIRRHLREMD